METKVKLLNLQTGTVLGTYTSEGLALYARQALLAVAPPGVDLFVVRSGESLTVTNARSLQN